MSDDLIDYASPDYLPTADQYADFFHSSLTNLQRSLLLAHYAAPEHCARHADIGAAVGTAMEAVNSAIGRLGRKIIDLHNVTLPERSQVSHAISWFQHGDDGFYYATLHNAVIAALVKLEWDSEAHERFDSFWRARVPSAPARNYWEGRAREASVISRARNGQARRICIEHWQCKCYVCAFDFAAAYGPLGEGFIEVHHLAPMSEQPTDGYDIDPVEDLRPVCSNCHRMLHRDGLVDIDDLRAVVRKRSR